MNPVTNEVIGVGKVPVLSLSGVGRWCDVIPPLTDANDNVAKPFKGLDQNNDNSVGCVWFACGLRIKSDSVPETESSVAWEEARATSSRTASSYSWLRPKKSRHKHIEKRDTNTKRIFVESKLTVQFLTYWHSFFLLLKHPVTDTKNIVPVDFLLYPTHDVNDATPDSFFHELCPVLTHAVVVTQISSIF